MGSRFVQVTFRFRDEMSRGMDSVSKKLKGTSDKLQAQYSSLGKLGREWTKAGKSMIRTGDALTRKVTLPIVAASTAAGKLYMDFDKSMAQINTLLDDDSHLKGYEDAVMKVSDELGIKATTASEGLYQTISVLGDHGETTEKTFAIMARSAKAGGADVTDAVNMIATAMNGYGETSDETAQKISDLSFKTVKLGKTTFPELANEMSPLFPLANNLGISYEELYATMSTATTSFAGNTAEASTQIKGLMTGFLKPSKDMQALLDDMGYSSGAAMIKSEGLAGALEIVQDAAGEDGMSRYFGNVRGLTAALGLSGSGMDKFKKHLEEMQGASGATGDALAKMADTDAAKWNKALVKAQNAGIKFGKAVLPAVTPLVEKFGNAISKAADWFSNLSEGQQQMIVKALAIAAATGPVIKLLGKGATTVGSLLGTVSKFGKALDSVGTVSGALTKTFPVAGRLLTGFGKGFMAVGKLFISNPILIGIAAIAAGAIVIWKNWDKIKPHLQPILDKFKEIGTFFKNFKKSAGEKLEAVKSKFGELKTKAGDLKTGIANRFGAIKGKFNEVKNKAGDLKKGISNRFASIKESFGGLKDKAGNLKEGVANRFNSMQEKLGSFRDNAGATMAAAGTRIMAFMKSCSTSTSGVKGYLGGLINFVKGVFTGNWRAAWNGVKQAFQTAFNNIRSVASGALSGISSLVSGIVSKVTGLLSKLGKAKTAAGGIHVKGGTIPENAKGTAFFQGGWTRVHEQGGEILNLPRGTQIIPHDVSVEMARAAGSQAAGSRNINIAKLADTVVVREDADIDKIVQAFVEKLEMLAGDTVYA